MSIRRPVQEEPPHPAALLRHLIYRLMPSVEWARSKEEGYLVYNADDKRDGFMHISAPHQVMETANKHYNAYDALIVLGIDKGAIAEMLKWEPSRGGELFPHAYGRVPATAVVHQLSVEKGRNGTFHIGGDL
ncbi:MAG: DUF952 domain-containing protein [Pseudomonadota bacterium]